MTARTRTSYQIAAGIAWLAAVVFFISGNYPAALLFCASAAGFATYAKWA